LKEFPFQHVELRHSYAANFGVKIISAKGITKTFACNCYCGDDEPMAGERGKSKERHPHADLIDIVQRKQ